jgi:hypothetical protein
MGSYSYEEHCYVSSRTGLQSVFFGKLLLQANKRLLLEAKVSLSAALITNSLSGIPEPFSLNAFPTGVQFTLHAQSIIPAPTAWEQCL